MINTLFFLFMFIWIIASFKATYWMTLTAIGWKTEVPLYFLKYQFVYLIIPKIIFLSYITLFFFQSFIPWWSLFIALPILYFLVRNSARKAALNDHRKILYDLIKYAKKNSEDTTMLEQEYRMSDDEVLKRARENIKMNLI